jgi:transcriptional regulator with XRE-family HTH domain
MSKGVRQKPERLAEKLRHIRDALGLSQSEMLRLLGLEEAISYTKISHYELGRRQPSFIELLRYAEVAGVCTDVLIRDDENLPTKLPSKPKHDGAARVSSPRERGRRGD